MAANPLEDPMGVQAILEVLAWAGGCATYGHRELCRLSGGKDHRTCTLSPATLSERPAVANLEFTPEGSRRHLGRPWQRC